MDIKEILEFCRVAIKFIPIVVFLALIVGHGYNKKQHN